MQIRNLFSKPPERPINGVIKADQLDAESVWQELDEYVVTKQLSEYFRRFFDAFLTAADNPSDPVLSSRMGVWVSGFFGSGKSHFLKIISYLLENVEVVSSGTGERKRAIDFFDEQKINDALLLADIRRAVGGSTDVILFNIDAKADSKSDRDAILQVFQRVFNEKAGFSGDAPHIAHMERYLVSKGVYTIFQDAFQEKNGSSWRSERDASDFLRDDIAYALSKALNISEESAVRTFDDIQKNFSITIEGFANLVRSYLESKPKGHRIAFLVDEVGQFIGDNKHLMLTLQTITETLGTICQGRAWVVVTSQEDIDKAIGETNKSHSQDFSKIQGRFHTRLSLASSNTDEVISKRLLAKTEGAHKELRDLFEKNGDIINNQISFIDNSVALRNYQDSAEFVDIYPFVPYQFSLLQKIFESIRKVGATGQHLSKGERSLLDAFQSAVVGIGAQNINPLVPLYDFYPSIESFIETSVKRSIDESPNNPELEPYDVSLLKALFLIRYISDFVRPNVENLATLCLDRIDMDKLALKHRIQESLNRLEKQRLVNRNGVLWFFLTNEERDVAREIDNLEVSSDEKSRLLSEMVYEEILEGKSKIRHKPTKGDYEFNRLLDGMPWKQANHSLTLEIISPLADDYADLSEARCIQRSQDRALIRLSEGESLDKELALYKRIEKYAVSPKASTESLSLKRIISDRKDENRIRHDRILKQLSELLVMGNSFVLGQKFQTRADRPEVLAEDLVNDLISNTYTKLSYLKVRQADPIAEIKAVLTSGDGPMPPDEQETVNALALREVRDYLKIAASQSRVLLSDVVDRFTGVPFGWKPDWETVLLVARLFMAGEINLTFEGSDLVPKTAIELLTKSVRLKQISILMRKKTGEVILRQARDLYKDLFSSLAREDEDGLIADFREKLGVWKTDFDKFQKLAENTGSPGRIVIEQVMSQLNRQLAIRDPFEFIGGLVSGKETWLDLSYQSHEVKTFYDIQVSVWRRMRTSLEGFRPNHEELIKDSQAAIALENLEAILANPSPYEQISRIDPLLERIESVNRKVVQESRVKVLTTIEKQIAEVKEKLELIHADPDLRNQALYPIQKLKEKILESSSIPEIFYLRDKGGELLDDSIGIIEKAQTPPPKHGLPPPPGPNKAPRVIRASSLAGKMYMETEGDVEDYISKLRAELLSAIQSGQRARIE